MNLDINGKITLSEKDIIIETSLPTLQDLLAYESELNKNLDFLKKELFQEEYCMKIIRFTIH